MQAMTILHTLLAALLTPAKPEAPAMSEHSEFLDYAEAESRRTLDDIRGAFNSHFDRALKVVTLLIGGAGAVAAYVINNWQRLDVPAQWGLLALVFGWSGVAVFLGTRGMRKRRLDTGANLMTLARTYADSGGNLNHPVSATQAARALQRLRMAELNRAHLQNESYIKAVSEQTRDMRFAVVLASVTPLLSFAVWISRWLLS